MGVSGGGSVAVGSTGVFVGGGSDVGGSVAVSMGVGSVVGRSVGVGVGGLGVTAAVDGSGFSRTRRVGVIPGLRVGVGVVVDTEASVESSDAVMVDVGVGVIVAPVTGMRISVAPNNNASTVEAAAVLRT